MSVAEWADTYGIHHWWILWSSYRKLAWVEFELTTTKFRSDALTDWAIRPWVQLTLRGHFVQLLQFQCHISFWLFVFLLLFFLINAFVITICLSFLRTICIFHVFGVFMFIDYLVLVFFELKFKLKKDCYACGM